MQGSSYPVRNFWSIGAAVLYLVLGLPLAHYLPGLWGLSLVIPPAILVFYYYRLFNNRKVTFTSEGIDLNLGVIVPYADISSLDLALKYTDAFNSYILQTPLLYYSVVTPSRNLIQYMPVGNTASGDLRWLLSDIKQYLNNVPVTMSIQKSVQGTSLYNAVIQEFVDQARKMNIKVTLGV